MSVPTIYSYPPIGSCQCWCVFVKAADLAEHGHIEGEYVVGDFGDLVKLSERQRFDAGGLHEYDDAALWAYWPRGILEACGHQPPRDPKPINARDFRALARIESKLERWELQHLRELAAHQAERIDELERSASDAERCAELWQDMALQAQDALAESGAGQMGITRDGQAVFVPVALEWQPV